MGGAKMGEGDMPSLEELKLMNQEKDRAWSQDRRRMLGEQLNDMDKDFHSAKIESVLDNLHCGLRGDQTEKLARQMYERGVRFYG